MSKRTRSRRGEAACIKQVLFKSAGWLAALIAVCLSIHALTRCTAAPDIDGFLPEPGRVSPETAGDGGRLPARSGKADTDRFARQTGPADVLEYHLARVRSISGGPLIGGNRVTLLRDGPETLDAMSRAIRGARDHIHLETFIIRDDKVGRSITDLLIAKRSEGVRVRFIYDSYGAGITPDGFFERLSSAGVQLYEFNPIGSEAVDFADSWGINNRDHRKILVIDGKTAFTGGVNLYDVYAGSPSSVIAFSEEKKTPHWRDTHIRIEGPAVAEFQKLFLKVWNIRDEGRVEHSPKSFPELENQGDALIRVICSTPQQRLPGIYAAYLSAVENARSTIHLTQAYFLPGERMISELARAARRGLDVKVILPGKSDFWMPVYAGRYHYRDLLEAGVKLYQMRSAVLHSKTAVVDGVWSTVGSSNFDMRSFLHDAEVNAVILDRDFAEKMEEMFQADLEGSDEILLEDWKKRPLKGRFMEWFAHLFRYWL